MSSVRVMVIGLVAVMMVAVLAACGTEEAVEPDPTNPFQGIVSGEDGRIVGVEGWRLGHQPGGVSDFEVTFQNGSNETWQGEYCLLLVRDGGIVSKLATATFDVEPEEGVTHTVAVTLPAGVEVDHYGLMFLNPGRQSMTSLITVGDPESDAPASLGAPVGTGCATGTVPDAEFTVEREPFTGDLMPSPAN